MKTKLLASLKTKFSGVDEAILNRIAEKKVASVTDESQLDAVVENIGFADVLNSYGDFRANSAVQTAVANYERKHGLKDGKPIDNPDKKEANDDISTLIAEAVAKSVTPLMEKINAFETQKAQETRAAQVKSKAKEYGIPETFVSMLKVDDDADLDEFFKDAQQTFTNAGFKNVVPPGTGGGKGDNVNDIAELIAKDTAARMK